MVEQIEHAGRVMALIVSGRYHKAGVKFFTSGELSQQLAYISHPTGHVIPAHVHNPVQREVHLTQETLLIRKGKLRVDFYSREHQYLESRILEAGDVILLVDGGHGFEVLEDVEVFEVKQGPFVGDQDKTVFVAPSFNAIIPPRD